MISKLSRYIRQGGFPFLILCLALLICNRGGYISLVGVFVLSVFVTVNLKQKMDLTGAGLILYSILYMLISMMNGFSYDLSVVFLYAVAPFFFYSFGRVVPYKWQTEDQQMVFWLLIIACYCLDIFYVTANNILSTGELINIKRDFSFDAAGDMDKAATLVGLAMDVGMVGLPIFILAKKKAYRYLFLLLSLLSLVVTIHLLNRTGLVVLFLCFAGVIFWKSRKQPYILVTAMIFVAVLYFLIQSSGLLSDELFSYYDSRNEDISSMGSRSFRWTYALEQLFIQPLGWAQNGEIYYVHNMWLDIARISGIIPFILLLSFTVSGVLKSLRYIKRTENVLSYLLLGLNMCFFASCFVEPVYGGTHFLLYCMLWGVLTTLDKKSYTFIG